MTRERYNPDLELGTLDWIDSGASEDQILTWDAVNSKWAADNLGTLLAGTTNRVTLTADGDNTYTLTTPQDTHTGASPTFVGETLSGLTASRLVGSDGSKALASWV